MTAISPTLLDKSAYDAGFELRDRPGGGAAARLTLPAFHPDAAQVEGTGE